jgi:RNA polymerase sigma-70 factor, ECF subfamily
VSNSSPTDERACALQFLRDRDESTFLDLYRRFTPMLYRVAYRMAPQAAAEIVQDTWVRALQKLPEFRWESRLSTWLVGIAINRSREEIRRNRAESMSDEVEPIARAALVPDHLDLEVAIAQLAEGYREILLLHDVEGYTHEEIAQALKIEPATSRSQLARARAVLRELLGKNEVRK